MLFPPWFGTNHAPLPLICSWFNSVLTCMGLKWLRSTDHFSLSWMAFDKWVNFLILWFCTMNEGSQALNLCHLIWTSQIPNILGFCFSEEKLKFWEVRRFVHFHIVAKLVKEVRSIMRPLLFQNLFSTIIGGHNGIFW